MTRLSKNEKDNSNTRSLMILASNQSGAENLETWHLLPTPPEDNVVETMVCFLKRSTENCLWGMGGGGRSQ